jgi:hypothetical protein
MAMGESWSGVVGFAVLVLQFRASGGGESASDWEREGKESFFTKHMKARLTL